MPDPDLPIPGASNNGLVHSGSVFNRRPATDAKSLARENREARLEFIHKERLARHTETQVRRELHVAKRRK